MSLKLNIQPRLEKEMEDLIPAAGVRSKTEYINRAIESYNHEIKRDKQLGVLRSYFEDYRKEASSTLKQFAKLRHASRD